MPPPIRRADPDYHFHTYDYANSAAWTLSPQQPQRGNLRFYSMVQDLQGLVATGVLNNVPNVAVANLGQAIAGDGVARDIMALSFGGPNPIGNTAEVLITAGIHAREWVAPEMAYLLAEYLIRNYPPNNLANPTAKQTILKNLIDTRRIHIIPMLNPNGNSYSVFSQQANARLWRVNRRTLPSDGPGWLAAIRDNQNVEHPPFQNARVRYGICDYDVPRYSPGVAPGPGPAQLGNHNLPNANFIGVDINRNFDTLAWGYDIAAPDTNAIPPSDGYFGPRRLSELETGSIAAFIGGLAHLEASIDYHSFGRYILYPTEAHDNGRVGQNYQNLGEILQRLIAPRPGTAGDYQLGTPLAIIHYDAVGTLADHAANTNNNSTRAFVVELDGGPPLNPPAQTDGFLLPETDIRRVFEKNIRGALALIAAGGQQSTWQVNTYCCCFHRRTISSGERVYLNWNVYGRGNRMPT